MTPRKLAPLVVSFVLFCACAGRAPVAPRSCTDLPCLASAVVTSRVAPSDAGVGTHTFEIEVDGVTSRCSVVRGTEDHPVDATCDGPTSLTLGPVMGGQTTKGSAPDAPVEYVFAPVPGQFEWRLTIPGVHRDVRITHALAGRVISARSASLAYHESRPNGPTCEPACQVATLALP